MDKFLNQSVVLYSVKSLFSVEEKHRGVFAFIEVVGDVIGYSEKLVTGAMVMTEIRNFAQRSE